MLSLISYPLTQMKNAMTVDVEDYFHVSAFEPYISRNSWDAQPQRVEGNVDRILELFDAAGVRATFFTLGWVAERHPAMVQRIVAQGHEIASHGYEHIRATEQTRRDFREDIVRTKGILEDIARVSVIGYRAATFSISRSNLWVWDELADAGYKYSSSLNPIRHDLYGIPDAPRFPFKPTDGRFCEIPITSISLGGRNFPCGGGGFFRLLPYCYFRWALKRVNGRENMPGLFYFHPWELDPSQPRQYGLSARTRFRHYTNLAQMEERLERLLVDFEWGRMDEVFLEHRFLQTAPQMALTSQ